MKYCQECGRMLRDSDKNCPYCGTFQDILETGTTRAFTPERNTYTPEDNAFTPGGSTYAPEGNAYMYEDTFDLGGMGAVADGGLPIKKYSFWKITLLGIVTFGIYSIYKTYQWTKDVNRLCKGVGKESPNYILVLLLSIVTFGIYGLIWFYRQTERLKETGYINGVKIEDSGVQSILLLILGSGLGGLALWYILYDNTNRLSSVFNGEASLQQANQKTSHRGVIVGVAIAIVALYLLSTIIAITTALFAGLSEPEKTEEEIEEWLENEIESIPGEDGENLFGDEFDEDLDYSLNYLITDGDYESQGESADFGNYKISIEKAENVYDYEGKRAVAVTFTWENNSDEEASALWVFLIDATQNGKSLMQTWPSYGDDDFFTNEYMENIKPGESLTFHTLFLVENENDPVTVKVVDFMGESKMMAERTFNLGE